MGRRINPHRGGRRIRLFATVRYCRARTCPPETVDAGQTLLGRVILVNGFAAAVFQ